MFSLRLPSTQAARNLTVCNRMDLSRNGHNLAKFRHPSCAEMGKPQVPKAAGKNSRFKHERKGHEDSKFMHERKGTSPTGCGRNLDLCTNGKGTSPTRPSTAQIRGGFQPLGEVLRSECEF